MHRYNCIIVEDEPLAAEVIKDYIEQVPFLQLKGICTDALYAMDLLQKEYIDLVFLDIHLPKLKGLDFIKALKKPPQIIITSAYQEYALQGYELNVVDYLLKPIEFNRFLMAVNKLKERGNGDALPVLPAAATERAALFFNVSKKRVKIYIDEILFIESLKEYIRITTKEKSILTKFQLGQIEEMLAKNGFLRVHRSFLVAKSKIDAFSATDVEINGEQIPIGRSYKDVVMSILES
ncbi:DNA-binding response regulator [Niastella koreensis]|uniref:Two component transcriptional regulator, LytTR family n=2 Tax=Niastella koreensis TaxID=354356 RepID=G8TBE7_NIAKG|nr:LytTR family DNA-binding domain-containing protein [Niastella koreensis]AEW03447.1 two component transcriptional regulator, LytTR family [Niastella koreensis GR20-10]OQP53816.1 DNA-binding response regulator [Niastella koreensis]